MEMRDQNGPGSPKWFQNDTLWELLGPTEKIQGDNVKFNLDKLTSFFETIHNLPDEEMVSLVEANLPDDAIEVFIDHIHQFYGIEDEEQLGLLAQLMVVGFMSGQHHYAQLLPALSNNSGEDNEPPKTRKKNVQ